MKKSRKKWTIKPEKKEEAKKCRPMLLELKFTRLFDKKDSLSYMTYVDEHSAGL